MKTQINPQDLQTVTQYAQEIANAGKQQDRRMERFKEVYEATGDVQLAAAFLRFLQQEDMDVVTSLSDDEEEDTPEVIKNPYNNDLIDGEPLTVREINRSRKAFYKQYYKEINNKQSFFLALLGRRLCYTFNCLTGKVVWCGQSITQYRINEACSYIKRYNDAISECEDPDWKKKCLYERKLLTKKLAMLQYFKQ